VRPWEEAYIAERIAQGWAREDAELALRVMRPALRAAYMLVESLGRAPAPPLPRSVNMLGAVLERAERIHNELRLFDEGAVPFPSLFALHVFGTRPWSGPTDAVEDQDQELLLVPLAVALAEGWKMHGSEERDAVRQVAAQRSTTPDEVKVDLVARGVTLVQAERGDPQRVRIGAKWETDEAGHIRDVRPVDDLEWRSFIRWWRSRVLSVAREMLMDEAEAAETRGSDEPPMLSLDDILPLAAPNTGDDDVTERAREAASDVEALFRSVAPQQRADLAAILEAFRADPDADLAEAVARVAAQRGVGPKAVEMKLSRIRRRSASD